MDNLAGAVTHHQRLLHGRTAQIEVAVFEPEILLNFLCLFLVQWKRRSGGNIEYRDSRHMHLDCTGPESRIHRLFTAGLHHSPDANDRLRFQYSQIDAIVPTRMHHHLSQTIAITQINKQDSPVVT